MARRATKTTLPAMKPGARWVDAVLEDVEAELARHELVDDPPPDRLRNGIRAGQWPGAPSAALPPGCPVTPLGINGKTCWLIDSLGQLVGVQAGEWGHKILTHLFARAPNFVWWAWPRYSEKTKTINGIEANEAAQCLTKACADRGLFDPADKVRGRGAWTTRSGLVWHAGDRIYRVSGGRLEEMAPGEIDRIFYPHRPAVTVPWRAAVPPEESPAGQILDRLRSWNWERPMLDPLLVVGWIGCAYVGGALDWRPHLYTTGDKGVGKSTLHELIKALFGLTLHSTADTSPAGIYQRVQQDSLPCAIDELEATADNRRVAGVMSLARLASSGAVMYRGGAEHQGVQFSLRNTFFMSGINPPPMEPADKSRLAILNLGKLDPSKVKTPLDMDPDTAGRMILRSLMDGWPRLQQSLAYWKDALRAGGIDSRGQDTWGTLLAVANIMLGDKVMADAGLPVDDEKRLGAVVAAATAMERSEITENWISCLHRLFGGRIDAWKGGEQPTVGSVIEEWEAGTHDVAAANDRLRLVGLMAQERDTTKLLTGAELEARLGSGERKMRLLAVPMSRSPGLDRLFWGSKWSEGVWASALKQAPANVVIRHLGNGQNVKINRQSVRCLLIDLRAYDQAIGGDDPPPDPAPEFEDNDTLDDPFGDTPPAAAARDYSQHRKARFPTKEERR